MGRNKSVLVKLEQGKPYMDISNVALSTPPAPAITLHLHCLTHKV